jgi:hypothetical protein
MDCVLLPAPFSRSPKRLRVAPGHSRHVSRVSCVGPCGSCVKLDQSASRVRTRAALERGNNPVQIQSSRHIDVFRRVCPLVGYGELLAGVQRDTCCALLAGRAISASVVLKDMSFKRRSSRLAQRPCCS